MCLSTHILFLTCFITLFPARPPRVNLMHLRTEDQPHLPAVLSEMLQAENLAIFHLWGFLQSPLLLTISELTLDQYENNAPSNTPITSMESCCTLILTLAYPSFSPTTAQKLGNFQVSLSDTHEVWNCRRSEYKTLVIVSYIKALVDQSA